MSVSVCMSGHCKYYPFFFAKLVKLWQAAWCTCFSSPATISGFDWGLDSELATSRQQLCCFETIPWWLWLFVYLLRSSLANLQHMISLYFCWIQSIFSFISHPGPAAGKHHHSMMLPRQDFMVEMVFWLTPNIAFSVHLVLLDVSSDHKTFCYMGCFFQ